MMGRFDNSKITTHHIVFVRVNEFGTYSYLNRDDNFRFRPDDKFSTCATPDMAYQLSNNINNLPDFIFEFCKQHDFEIMTLKTFHSVELL